MKPPGRSQDPEALAASGDYLQAGRLWESRQRIAEALDAYERGGAFAEAARVLGAQGRLRDAGLMLLRTLPDAPTPVERLSQAARRDALGAAMWFARAGARAEAVGILVALGENQRAASLLSMAGRRDDAARAMRGEPVSGSPWAQGCLNSLGAPVTPRQGTFTAARVAAVAPPPARPVPAPWGSTPAADAPTRPPPQERPTPALRAQSSEEVRRPPPPPLHDSEDPNRSQSRLGAAVLLPDTLQPGGELWPYLDMAADDPAAGHVVPELLRAAWPLEPLPMPVSRLLDRMIEGAIRGVPVDPAVLYATARLYEYHVRVEAAKNAYRVLSARGAGFHDSQARLGQLEEGLAESVNGTWLPPHILVSGFHDYAPRPSLEDLPLVSGGNISRIRAQLATPNRVDPPKPGPLDAYGDGAGFRDSDSALPPLPPLHSPALSSGGIPWDQASARQSSPADPRSSRPSESRKADETMGFAEYVVGGAGRPGDRLRDEAASHGERPRARTADGFGERASTEGGSLGGFTPLDPGTIQKGSLIADRYRIDDVLGTGGMAVVYRATDQELEEQVAIKVFLQVVQHKDGLARFRREMKLSRKLVHPNIVRIFEFGLWRGARFITMELLKGDDLERFMKHQPGPLPTSVAMRLVMQAADGLGAAHKAGIIHRDVKPQNMFVLDGGKKLKLMDFGIAKANDSTSISATDVRVGTPRYMSPEQIQGGSEVGPAADLYALGAVMYEMFTGFRVFEEEDLVPLLMCHLAEEPRPPRQRNSQIPPSVEIIILRLLRKRPEERFADSAELRKALLEAYVDTERLPAR